MKPLTLTICDKCNRPTANQNLGIYSNGPTCKCWLEADIRKNPSEVYYSQNFNYYTLLKQRYDTNIEKNPKLDATLFLILYNLEKGNNIDDYLIDWLIQNGFNKLVAEIYYCKYFWNKNLWTLTKACKQYRKSDNPQKVIEITQDVTSEEHKVMSAILTTRGGAYRDLDMIQEAFDCGTRAIKISPKNSHPYNLMGALCFDMQQYNEGYQYFNKALELSREKINEEDQANIQKQMIIKSFTKNPSHRQELIDYLLNKDPQKYQWTRTYWNLPPTPANSVVI